MSIKFLYTRTTDSLQVELTIDGSVIVIQEAGETEDLMVACCLLLEGMPEILLQLRQTEYLKLRIRINKLPEKLIRICIFEQADYLGFDQFASPDNLWTKVYDKSCGLLDFAKAIYNGMDEHRKEEDSGTEHWEEYFAWNDFRKLGEALKNRGIIN